MSKRQSTDEIIEERSVYGDYESNAGLSQALKEVIRCHPKFHALPYDVKESLELIILKMSRIVNGDFTYIDNWFDIQGYALLIEKRLIEETEKQE